MMTDDRGFVLNRSRIDTRVALFVVYSGDAAAVDPD